MSGPAVSEVGSCGRKNAPAVTDNEAAASLASLGIPQVNVPGEESVQKAEAATADAAPAEAAVRQLLKRHGLSQCRVNQRRKKTKESSLASKE
jgi:hypothetical protein